MPVDSYLTEDAVQQPGIVRALWKASQGLRGMILTHMELIAIELREEKKRLVSLVVFGLGAMFLGFMTLIALTFAIAELFPDERFGVLLGFGIFYLVSTIGFAMMLKKRLSAPAFPETMAQLKKDKEELFSRA